MCGKHGCPIAQLVPPGFPSPRNFFTHPVAVLLLQETGISGISGVSPAGFWELLLRVGVGVQEEVDTPLQGSTRSSQLSFSLGKKGRKKGLPLPWERRVLAPAPEKFAQLRDVESQNIPSWK